MFKQKINFQITITIFILLFFSFSPVPSVEKVCRAATQMTVYMPHLTGTPDNQPEWSDYLEIDNYSRENADINIILYNENGSALYNGGLTMPALQNEVIDLKTLAGNARCGKIIYDNPKLNFRLAYENNFGGGVAEFRLNDELDDNLGFYFSDFTPAIIWKGMALCNWGAVTANISLKAQGNGVEHNGPTLSVAPNTKIVGTFAQWFPTLNFNQVKRILISSDQPTIDGITISGDGSGSLLLFTTATPINIDSVTINDPDPLKTITLTSPADSSSIANCSYSFVRNAMEPDPNLETYDILLESWCVDDPALCGNFVDLGPVDINTVNSYPSSGYISDCVEVDPSHTFISKNRDGSHTVFNITRHVKPSICLHIADISYRNLD